MQARGGAQQITGCGRIGDVEVTSISDGLYKTSTDVVLGVERAECRRLLGITGSDVYLSVNSFLLNINGKLALVDTGGSSAMVGLGHLPDNLRAAGSPPEAIDYVLLTHFHPDHSNGLIDASGQAAYPNAQLVVHEREARFWLGRTIPPDDTERLRRNTEGARRTSAPYRDRMRTVADGEVLPGVSAVLLPGHTPGHTGWLVRSGADAVLIWGDIVHIAGIQIPRPDATLVFDVAPEAARASRQRTFDWVATERLRVAGAHRDGPGFGYIVRDGTGYRYEPEA